jgi:NAD(P)-dependent dehydrogenase (short-subunit alcohol dehydrogenase family)
LKALDEADRGLKGAEEAWRGTGRGEHGPFWRRESDVADPDGIARFAHEMRDRFQAVDVLVNSGCPGFTATDMSGGAGRPVQDGAASVVWAATLPDDGPTGGFFRDGRPLPR